MTYINQNNMMSNQHPQASFPASPASAMLQPGFAGTNPHEVQHWNHGGHIPATAAPTYGMSHVGGIGSAQAMFQPGFAGTNAQEVRQLNSGYAAPQQFGFMHHQQQGGYMQAQPAYQPLGAHASIFSPGFAGTNVQEVQARNHSYSQQTGYTPSSGYSNQGYGAHMGGGIFSPGFAGTNVQEVRQLNQGGYAPAPIMGDGFGMHAGQAPQPQQSLGIGAQSMFTPGFAGTNAQEVRQLNHEQGAPHTGSIFPGSL